MEGISKGNKKEINTGFNKGISQGINKGFDKGIYQGLSPCKFKLHGL